MPPKKQASGRCPKRAVEATAKNAAVPYPSPILSRSSASVESLHNRTKKSSSFEVSVLPDSTPPDSTVIVPAIPSASFSLANAEGNFLQEKHRNSSIETVNDKINAGNETLALENGVSELSLGIGSGREVEDPVDQSENANGCPLSENVSEVKPKKKTMKVVKVVKKVVKKRVPKSSLKSVATSSDGELAPLEILYCGGKRFGSGESFSLSIQEPRINNLSECSEDKGLEKEADILDHYLSGSMPEPEVGTVASSISAPFDFEKGDDGVNMSVQETDSSPKLAGVNVEVENFYISSNQNEASLSEILVDGETNEALGLEVPVGSERKEASVSEIPVYAGKTACIVGKSDSASEIPVEVGNADSVGDRDQVVGKSSGYEGRKEDSEISNGGIVLSGELEALERRRRRRTEIFIGGLNKNAKEEDVRKVFEEVGEIVELRLVINTKTGKNKGYAFVRYASATDAKKALEKYSNVEICGKQCSTAPVEGNDTIFLGNIDKNWKDEDVFRLLQEMGIEKIDKVTVMANPTNVERNRGFAFLELETYKDAQIAFKKLQKEDLGQLKNVKVDWAEPLIEPDEEELLQVKSVYAEYLPPTWNEEKVRSFFVKFGEIENVVLARNLHSSRRKDFAFINFSTREAALACVESFNHVTLHDEGSQVNVKVSLAKPAPKGKPQKKVIKSASKEISREKPRKYHVNPVDAKNKVTPVINVVNQRKDDLKPSGISELEQLLAERALRKQMQARTAIANEDYARPLLGNKRSFSALGDDLNYPDPRGYSRMRFENFFPVGRPSRGELPLRFGTTYLSYHHQQGADYVLGHRYSNNSNSLQWEEGFYRGVRGDYHRY